MTSVCSMDIDRSVDGDDGAKSKREQQTEVSSKV